MKKIYSIGEISKLFNIAVSTLRYYDEKHILKPIKVDEETNYRYYSIEQFETLSVILHLRAMDMSLDEIKRFVSEKSPQRSENHFKNHINLINDKLLHYEKIKNRLEGHLAHLVQAKRINRFEHMYFEDRYYVIAEKKINNNHDIDFTLRELNNLITDDNITITGQYGMLNKFPLEDDRKLFFLLVDKPLAENCSMFNKGVYIVYRYSGAHSDSKDFINLIREYIEVNSLEVEGEIIEITIINDAYTNSKEDYVTELQIKIAST